MQKQTYEIWTESLVELFTEQNELIPEWLTDDDLLDDYSDGLTVEQCFDKYVRGYWF